MAWNPSAMGGEARKSPTTAMPRPTLATAQTSAIAAHAPTALRTTPGRVCSPRCSRFHTTSSTMPMLSMMGTATRFEPFQASCGARAGDEPPSSVSSALKDARLADRIEHRARKA